MNLWTRLKEDWKRDAKLINVKHVIIQYLYLVPLVAFAVHLALRGDHEATDEEILFYMYMLAASSICVGISAAIASPRAFSFGQKRYKESA